MEGGNGREKKKNAGMYDKFIGERNPDWPINKASRPFNTTTSDL